MPAVITLSGTAGSVNDLLKTLPISCQAYSADPLITIYEMSLKYFHAIGAKEELLRMKTQGIMPSSLNSVKTPTVQVSQEYRVSSSANKFTELDTLVQQHRLRLLDQMIDVKSEESDFYHNNHLTKEKRTASCKKMADTISAALFSLHKVNNTGSLPPDIQTELKEFDKKAESVVNSVIELARSRHVDRQIKNSKKRVQKAAVDVEMTGTSGEVNEKSLEKSVASVMKRVEQSRRDKSKGKIQKTDRKRKFGNGQASKGKSSKKQRKS